MGGSILLRRGTGEDMNKTIEDLFNMTLNDFNRDGVLHPTENNAKIVAGGRKVITGINIAQYFFVEPLINELLEILPKPKAKEVFERVCRCIGTRIGDFYKPNEANNVLDNVIYHNRQALQKLGIAKEKWPKFGGEYPEELYMIEKGAGGDG